MDERELRQWIRQVKDGTISRRRIHPDDGRAGADRADGRPDAGPRGRGPRPDAGRPSRRPSGGRRASSRFSGGRRRPSLNPHFATGTKDQDASRIFYEPLGSFDPDGNIVPILAAEVPSCRTAGLAKDGMCGDLEAQERRPVARRQALHRRRRGLQLGVRVRSGHGRGDGRGLQGDRADRQGRQPHRQDRLQAAHAVLGDAFCGRTGQIIPKHLFEPFKGGEVARGAGEPQADRARARTGSSTSSPATWCAASSTRTTTSPTGRSSTGSR